MPDDKKQISAVNYQLPPQRDVNGGSGSGSGSGMGPSSGDITRSMSAPTRAPMGGTNISFGGVGGGRVPGYTGAPLGNPAPGSYSHPSGVGFTIGGGFAKGGEMGDADMAQDKALIKKAFRQHDAQEHKGGKGTKLKLAKGGKGTKLKLAKGGKPKKMAKGGSVSPASKRADGCATKGKTKGRFC